MDRRHLRELRSSAGPGNTGSRSPRVASVTPERLGPPRPKNSAGPLLLFAKTSVADGQSCAGDSVEGELLATDADGLCRRRARTFGRHGDGQRELGEAHRLFTEIGASGHAQHLAGELA